MKIFILVIIFSLLCKLNCKKRRILRDGDGELKAILKDKVKALLQHQKNKDTHLKDTGTAEDIPRGPIRDKLIPLLQEVLENKDTHLKDTVTAEDTHYKDIFTDKDTHLKDIIKDKLIPLLQEVIENKDTHLKDTVTAEDLKGIIKDKLHPLLQGNENNKKLDYFDGEASDQLFPGGDVADLFGNNQHYKIPDNYQDFGRRFILQYPYIEKKSADKEAEDDLHNTVKKFLENKQDLQEPLPIKAPPEFVLDIAKRSLLLDESEPKNHTDDIIQKNILRSGNYWNDVQKEEIDPKKMLRSSNSENNLESVRVEVKPGSKLYNLISMLKRKSPRLIYVINKDFE